MMGEGVGVMTWRRGGRTLMTVLTVVPLLAWAGAAHAQGRGGPNWTTTGSDAQRTAWVKTDPRISKESMQRPGFQLLWKVKLENQARQLQSLTQPMLLPNIISYKGFKALAFIGGSADVVYAIDYDLSKTFWKARMNTWPSPPGTVACPGALTTITRATPPGQNTAPPPAGGPRGANTNVYVVASDGEAHVLNPQTGDDLEPPAKFLPPGANAVGAVLIDPVLYIATAGRCGGAANGVWSIDLGSPDKTVRTWDTKGGSVAGTAGPVFGSDGGLYVATGDGDYSDATFSNAVVGLDPGTLAVKQRFTPGRTPFASSPVAFEHGGRHLIAAANADGRLYLLDAASLGGVDHHTPLHRSAPYANPGADSGAGALATFVDAGGTRWILAATGGPIHADAKFATANGDVTNGAIVAYKLADQGGAPTLQPGWVSRDMVAPVAPAIVNGVVFAIASGEHRSSDPQMTAAERAQRSRPAVLYALDAATGRELWSSGKTIASFVHAIAPSAGDGQVYVVTYDGTVYAFGIPLER
jgi:outer membrane protein assembly factor BamB